MKAGDRVRSSETTESKRRGERPPPDRRDRETTRQRDENPLSELQRLYGNRAVQRLMTHTGRSDLRLDPPNSPREREAERVAEQMDGASPIGGGGLDEFSELASRRHVGKRPLVSEERRFFESSLSHDFGDVLLHSGPLADEAARALDARAFTVGRDVVFRAGAYRPETTAGRRLLAHELTHVVQQRGGAAGYANLVQRQAAESKKSTETVTTETASEEGQGVSNKIEITVELVKKGRHSGSIRFVFAPKGRTGISARGETEGPLGITASAKAKFLDNKSAYKLSAKGGARQISAALAGGEVGIQPPGWEWLKIAVDAKALEGEIKFGAGGERKFNLLKVGVTVTGDVPESVLVNTFGLNPHIARVVNVSIVGRYEYNIPPEDVARLQKMMEAGRERLKHLEERGKEIGKKERLRAEQRADDAEFSERAKKRDELRRKDLKVRREADRKFGLRDKERQLEKLKRERKELREMLRAERKGLSGKASRSKGTKRARRRIVGLEGNITGKERLIHELEEATKAHKAKYKLNDKSDELRQLEKELADYDTRAKTRAKRIKILDAAIEKHQRIISKADDVIRRSATSLKSGTSKIAGRVLGRRLRKATAKVFLKLAAKFIPFVNILSIAYDIYELGSAIYDLATGRAALGMGGGGESGVEGGIPGGTGSEGTPEREEEGHGSGSDGGGGGENQRNGTTEGGGATGGVERSLASEGEGGKSTGEPAGTKSEEDIGDPFAAPPLHPRTRALLKVFGSGTELSGLDLRILDRAVPKDVSQEEFDAFLKRLKKQQPPSSPEELVGKVIIASREPEEEPAKPEGEREPADVEVTVELEPLDETGKERQKAPSEGTPPSSDPELAPSKPKVTAAPTEPSELETESEGNPKLTDTTKPTDPTPGSETTEHSEEEPEAAPLAERKSSAGPGAATTGEQIRDSGAAKTTRSSDAAGERLFLTPEVAAGLVIRDKDSGRIRERDSEIQALRGKSIRAPDGTTFIVDSVTVNVGKQVTEDIEIIGFIVLLTKTKSGSSDVYRNQSTVTELLTVYYDLKKQQIIDKNADYSRFYGKLGQLIGRGSKQHLKKGVMKFQLSENDRGKVINLGRVVTAKVERVVSYKKQSDGTYEVVVEIIPKELVEGRYGPVVDGVLRPFEAGTPLHVPVTIELTR